MSDDVVNADYLHDMSVNQEGINRAKINPNLSAQDACRDYREKNRYLPRRYW